MNYNENIEHASIEGRGGIEATIRRAPFHVRETINRRRVARGLDPVLARVEAAPPAAEPCGTGVWVERRGRLVAVEPRQPIATRLSTTTTSSSKPTRELVPFRVVILPAPGDAGYGLREHLAPGAFGDASSLNAGRWSVRYGHDGPDLAINGERLRAVDIDTGIALVWEPDPRSPIWPEVLAAFDANGGTMPVSVGMAGMRSRPSRIVPGTSLIVAAELRHVAILFDPADRPAYAGAVAVLRRSQWRDDDADLRSHLEAAAAASRFRMRAARSR